MDPFSNKTAIVTGGGSGIGKALCEDLASRGSVVIVADINTESARETASAIALRGGSADARHVDIADAESVGALVDGTVAEHQRLDYLFNHAGINILGDARDLRLEHWRRVINVNQWGVIYGTMSAFAIMAKQGYGHIVNTSSLTGLLPGPTGIHYSAAKHAIVGLSLSLRAEAADLGIKVSVVCPAFVESNMRQSNVVLNAAREKIYASMDSSHRKPMDAAEAARAILHGVARNEALIVFPRYARFAWWLYRLNPALLDRTASRMVRDFRRNRDSG